MSEAHYNVKRVVLQRPDGSVVWAGNGEVSVYGGALAEVTVDAEEQRYAVYVVDPANSAYAEMVATGTKEGIGPMLVQLHEEGQITSDHRVGIRDRVALKWIVNPWAKGTL